jgi:formate dehydrogenase gamma subunit
MIIRARRQALEPHVIRMTRLERITHFLFLSSFISLAYTGFVLMYPDGWFVQPLHLLGVTEAGRAHLHRGAAVLMTLLVLHHIYFILFTKLGREQGRHFLPRFQDLVDVYHNILFFLGRREERPRFDRFGYAEKAEYLALVWGTAVMVITGFILWFEQYSLAIMPLWLYEVFGIVHRLEAVLAVLSIIVWHFYYVFINPDESPMALTWLTGRMTHHELKETHPIDYERQVKDKEEK